MFNECYVYPKALLEVEALIHHTNTPIVHRVVMALVQNNFRRNILKKSFCVLMKLTARNEKFIS